MDGMTTESKGAKALTEADFTEVQAKAVIDTVAGMTAHLATADEVNRRFADLRHTVQSNHDSLVQRIEGRTELVNGQIPGLGSRVEDLGSQVEGLGSQVEGLCSKIEDLHDTIEGLRGKLVRDVAVVVFSGAATIAGAAAFVVANFDAILRLFSLS